MLSNTGDRGNVLHDGETHPHNWLWNTSDGEPVRRVQRTLMQAVLDADYAWRAELIRLFGKRAGDVRYTAHAHGEPGSTLRTLHDAYVTARDAWHAAGCPLDRSPCNG